MTWWRTGSAALVVVAVTGVPSPPAGSTTCAPMPMRERVAQLVWPAIDGDDLTAAAATFAGWGVGGAVVMSFPEGATVGDLLAFKGAGAVPLLLATDEEGGDVQRFRRFGVMPSASRAAATLTPAGAEAMVAAQATRLAAAGIDIVFAPVVDVAMPGGGGPIGDRSFSDDPAVVTEYAAAYVAGWQSAGILPVLKHFPGHGSASADTHDGIAVTPALDRLVSRDLVPYAQLATLDVGVMVAHVQVPGLDDGQTASLSSAAITGLLREQYGYGDALVFTDALGMQAITDTSSIPDAAERAIAAGADVVIFTNTDETGAVIDRLVAGVESGRLSPARVDDAVGRVLEAKGLDLCAGEAQPDET